jgi:hypothetical protein
MPWKEPLTKFLSDLRESFKEQNAIFVFKTIKTQVLSMIAVRRFESKLFHFPITHDTLVDTWKFIG